MHTPVNNFHENHHHLAYDARTNRQKNEDTVNIKKEKLWFMLVKIVSCLNSCNGCYRKIINYILQNIFPKNKQFMLNSKLNITNNKTLMLKSISRNLLYFIIIL